jgi:hypothetical protein
MRARKKHTGLAAAVGVLLGLASLLAGCGAFDDDLRYLPQPVVSIFLYNTPTGTALGRADETSWTPDWQNELSAAQPLDIAIWQGDLYVLAPGQLLQVELPSGRVKQRYNGLNNLVAIVGGDEHLFLADTLAGALVALVPLDGKVDRTNIPLGFKPRLVNYNSQKVYALDGATSIAVADERALTVRTTGQLPYSITLDQAIDLNGRLQVLQQNGATRYVVAVDANSNEVSPTPLAITYTSRAYSPYNRQIFAQEYTENVTQTGNEVDIVGFADTLRSFSMDFEGSRLYYHTRGTLLRYNLPISARAASTTTLGPLPGAITKGLHLYRGNP